jgi:hypothetical protein
MSIVPRAVLFVATSALLSVPLASSQTAKTAAKPIPFKDLASQQK